MNGDLKHRKITLFVEGRTENSYEVTRNFVQLSRVQLWWVLILFLSPKGYSLGDMFLWQVTSQGVKNQVFPPKKLYPELA